MIFNHKDLSQRYISWGVVVSLLSSFLVVTFIAGYIASRSIILNIHEGTYAIKPSVDTFSTDKLKDYLYELKINYPEVAIAQSMLETSNYKSPVFMQNHNLFGMKEPSIRPTTAVGTENGHAYYKDWRGSCVDYALWQARYTSKIEDRDAYIRYLGAVYAEDGMYEVKIRKLLIQLGY